MDLTQLNFGEFQIAVLVAAVAWLVVSAFVGYRIGTRKYRPMLGTILGMLTLPGWLVIALVPRKEPTYY
jgi:hypothetical protein